jgi:hypothetical protein
MIFVVLFLFGILLLSIQAIRIANSLIKIALLPMKAAVLLVVFVVCSAALAVQWLRKLASD